MEYYVNDYLMGNGLNWAIEKAQPAPLSYASDFSSAFTVVIKPN